METLVLEERALVSVSVVCFTHRRDKKRRATCVSWAVCAFGSVTCTLLAWATVEAHWACWNSAVRNQYVAMCMVDARGCCGRCECSLAANTNGAGRNTRITHGAVVLERRVRCWSSRKCIEKRVGGDDDVRLDCVISISRRMVYFCEFSVRRLGVLMNFRSMRSAELFMWNVALFTITVDPPSIVANCVIVSRLNSIPFIYR